MCGIAGIAGAANNSNAMEVLQRMSDRLIHRGPDASGIWMNESREAGFSHRRLSIVDLSEKASQPMHYLEGRYTIVFNGEIYNYIELREWLIRFNYTFKSDSDSEVLLALFDYKRERCVEYLDGMFAFSIWDEKEKLLFCARDRFGEKPFYFLEDNGFYFASEIKALAAVSSKVNVDVKKLQLFIQSGYKASPSETFFTNVQVLLPANYLIYKDGRKEVKRYWEIDLSKRTRYVRESQYVEHFFELFRRSVSRRLRCDVEAGSSLSGGLDSTAIAGCIKQLKEQSFKTFSARFENHSRDEGKWIDLAVQKIGVDNFQVFPNKEEFVADTEKLLYHQEFPISSTSVHAQWSVMKLAATHKVKVLLDGQGADEYLAGYDHLKYFAIWELYRSGKILSFRKEVKYLRKNSGGERSVGMKFMYDPILNMIGRKRSVFDKGYTMLERLKYAVENELPELLRYADRNSMSHSLEVRLPFLNHQLVEFVFSLPPDLIYHNGRTKYILREATKQVLPQEIYSRTDKVGFDPPDKLLKEDKVFVALCNDAALHLNKLQFEPGPDLFRNYIASNFLKVFNS